MVQYFFPSTVLNTAQKMKHNFASVAFSALLVVHGAPENIITLEMPLEHLDDGIPKTFLVSILRTELSYCGEGSGFSGSHKFPKITLHDPPGPSTAERNLPIRPLPRGRSWTLLRHVWRACCAFQQGEDFWGGDAMDGHGQMERNN